MAVAPAIPLIASGASAVAGPSTVAFAGITFGQIATAASIFGTAMSGLSSFQNQRAAAQSERIASRERAAELRLQSEQEKTQNAIEDLERQRRLRRALASQRAAGAGIVDESGNILNIQAQTQAEFEREGELANFKSGLAVTNLNRQAATTLRAGENAYIAGMGKARTSLIETASTVGTQGSDFRDTLRRPSTYTSPRTGETVTWNRR